MSGSQSTPNQAATPGNWIDETINGMQYKVLLPANYDPSVKYPVMLYLHQLDMGDDPSGLLNEVNPWFNSSGFRTDHPAIVVMPLLDQTADPSGQTINWGGVSTADSQGETNALAALKQVMGQYSVDTSRVYVTGNSMGGIGTEDMLIKYNAYTGTEGRIFAAGLALAGADYGQGYPQPNQSVVTELKNVPFWAIHGGQDTQVPLAWDQNLYAAEQATGGDMIYTQDNGLGHDVWDTYYPQTGSGSPLGWLFSQSTSGTTVTPPGTTPSANDTVVKAGSSAAIVDAGGNKWTITGGGQVAVNGTADATTANVVELAYVDGTVWQENASKLWWGKSSPSASWSPSSGTATSPLPASTDPTTTPPSTQPGTRDPSQIPFASNSVFNLPLGTGAQWMYNGQLANANIYINTTLSGYNENIYSSTAADPLVTITNTAAAGGTPGTFQVHIPAGAIPAGGNDATFSVDDASTHTWYSFGGFHWTGSNTATVSQGSGESDYGSGLQVDNSNWDEGVGTLRQSDLAAGAINHMLRMELPIDMLESYTNSVTQLAPYAWPQTQEDGFAINGNGGPPYSGTVPYGVTIGIAANAVEPADVKANAGANMLWHALQTHGAMVRDSGGSGNTVIFQADQTVNGNDPLILGMEQYGAEIMAQAEILANQGPNSVNGGGTPIVPLDPQPSDMPGAGTTVTASANDSIVLAGAQGGITDGSGNVWTITTGGQVAVNGAADGTTANVIELAYVNGTVWQENASKLWWGKSSPTASWSPSTGSSTSPLPGGGNVAQTQTGTTIALSRVSVSLPASSTMLFVSGTGDVISVSGGAQSITDTGGKNTFVLPAGGHGSDTFAGNILNLGDKLDLRAALAATDWKGDAGALPGYLSVTSSGGAAVLSIAPTSGGTRAAIATISGASGTTLSALLTHALT